MACKTELVTKAVTSEDAIINTAALSDDALKS
jgi:hypothetical protein